MCNMCIQLHLEDYVEMKNSVVDLRRSWNRATDCK